jgi:uncharacterized protein YutE (UPF0331/DUF86 family)
MTDARWIDVFAALDEAVRHFTNAALLYDEGGFDARGLPGYRANMALMHAMQSAHTSLEGALARILAILGEEIPTGPSSHEDLVARVSKPVDMAGLERPAILTENIAADLHESCRFRHKVVHGYDSFEAAKAAPSVDAARRLAASLKPAIEAFRDQVDPNGT